MIIKTTHPDISLRLIEFNDAQKVFDLINNSRDYMKKWLGWIDFTREVTDTETFIQTCLNDYELKKSLNTVILFKGEIVGIAGYNSINYSNKTAYIGYWLGQDYQGFGIMTYVAKALTTYAFQELHFNKVEIRAAVENYKSRSIPERLGYIEEGTIRQAEWLYDHFVDHVVYGILADEWTI